MSTTQLAGKLLVSLSIVFFLLVKILPHVFQTGKLSEAVFCYCVFAFDKSDLAALVHVEGVEAEETLDEGETLARFLTEDEVSRLKSGQYE